MYRCDRARNGIGVCSTMPLIFDADHLPPSSPEYVVWVDVMGIQVAMSCSLARSANFIFKLHTAALQAPNRNVTMYPVMDGLYASSASQNDILNFVKSVMRDVATEFIRETNMHHRFVVKGALAFGPVIHGNAIPQLASTTLHRNQSYRDSLLLGLPMVQANACEKLAPPFGIYVHESARSFAPIQTDPIHVIWWKWQNPSHPVWGQLGAELDQYFDWCEERAGAIGYECPRIIAHRVMAKQYVT